MPVTPGLARGRSPRPAPDWLHQLPLWIRRSILEPLICSSSVPVVRGPVGRADPPQPLREVSINMPILDGIPCVINSWRNACTKLVSSLYRFQSIHFDGRVVSFTVMYG